LGLRDLQAKEKYAELRQKAAKIIRTEENEEDFNRFWTEGSKASKGTGV